MPPLRPYQAQLFASEAVDDLTISAPQLGKTVGAELWLLGRSWEHGADDRPWWWTAPSYEQVKHGLRGLIAFARSAGILHSFTQSPPLEVRIGDGGGIWIQGRSWERPENLYGPTVLGGVGDEFGMLTDPGYSAISSRRAETITQGLGRFLWIGNVGEIGGTAERLWRMAEAGAHGFAHRRWTWRDRAMAHECVCGRDIPIEIEHGGEHGGVCPQGIYLQFLAGEKARLSDPQFRQLYGAEWVDWNLLPAYDFDRAIHVDAERAQRSEHLPLDLSCDFNRAPMAWTIGQHTNTESWTFDEIELPGGARTAQAAAEFVERYADERVTVEVFGDATGKHGSTKSKQSDYDIIRDILGPAFREVRMRVPTGNPGVSERLNAANARLRAADGTVRHWLHPRCVSLANDYARVSLKPGTHEIEKKDKSLTHFSDADTYRLAELYPVKGPAPAPAVVTSDPGFADPMLSGSF